MADANYQVAFEKGPYLPDRRDEPWAVEAAGPAHAIEARFAPGAQPPFTAACGAEVRFVVDRYGHGWPPAGVARCPACTRLVD